jgi:cellulose biosynthesis protein BcsQ
VHLALQVDEGRASLDSAALESDLAVALGSWFAPPILGPLVSREAARLRGTVLGLDSPWKDASWTDLATSDPRQPRTGRWHLVERHLSKLSWVDGARSQPPWPLAGDRPAIVTYYSFKGGVGRTTLLASTAWQLARDRKRVVVVDLDLEAPGLGALLGARTERGVVDFLVDHSATGARSLDGLTAPASELGDEAGLVDVIPAGRLDRGYFEKLARLDFTGSGLFEADEARPVREGLRALMWSLAALAPRPDFVLLDSRAGLHDLAGLSLHDLAHVDVLVGRDSDQGYQGLELTVEALGLRRPLREIRSVVVQTMAPDDPRSAAYAEVTAAYRRRSYDAFAADVYAHDEGDVPALDDDQAGHYPQIVRFDPRLVTFSSLSVRRAEILGEDFERVKQRILALCAPEVPA